MKLFRTLHADEIECRVSRITTKGVVLLLYKTARTDADLLDETFSPTGWKNDFKIVDGVLYGGVALYDKDKSEWIWKWDAGTESNTEAEKGRASDAFKRAGFKWGLGRELYSAPFTFVPASKCNIENGKCYDNFEVMDIDYTPDERICYLRIGLKGITVFEWGEPIAADPDAISDDDLICEDCGRPIRDAKKKDGSPWKAADIAKYTKRGEGRQLCYECGLTAAAERTGKPKR